MFKPWHIYIKKYGEGNTSYVKFVYIRDLASRSRYQILCLEDVVEDSSYNMWGEYTTHKIDWSFNECEYIRKLTKLEKDFCKMMLC
jgi:hypothetical protein